MHPKLSPYSAFAARLHKAFDRTGIARGRSRTTAVATQFTVSRETSRLWLVGSAMPELVRLIDIADFCHCSLDWLATGQGAIDISQRGVRDDTLAATYGNSLTADEQLVVSAMRAMKPNKRQGLVALLTERPDGA